MGGRGGGRKNMQVEMNSYIKKERHLAKEPRAMEKSRASQIIQGCKRALT